MDAHFYEEQQLERLKAFWYAYGKRLFIAFLFAVTLYFAWDSWQMSKKNHLAHASNIYTQLMNYELLSQHQDAHAQAKVLIEKFDNTPYAAFASFYLAKEAVQAKEWEEAKNHLQWVVSHTQESPFVQIAQLRLARLQLAMGAPEAANETLSKLDPDGYLILSEIIKAETSLHAGNRDTAIATLQRAYQQAATVEQAELQPYIRSKLNELGVAVAS